LTHLHEREPEEITLLVLERGAPWPSWAPALRARADHLTVEVQTEDESDPDFAVRMKARFERLTLQAIKVAAAGYVCAPSAEQRSPLRKDVCHGLLALLDLEVQPELTIGAAAWDIRSLERTQLIQLWGELSQARPRVTVSVCFDEQENNSGVFKATPAHGSGHPVSQSSPRKARPSTIPPLRAPDSFGKTDSVS